MTAELAWAAGFFDGEGNIHIGVVKSKWKRIVLTIAQTEPTTLHRFCAAVGEGTVRGPYVKPNPRHSPVWYWSVEGPTRVGDVMDKLWPYLSEPKKAQTEEAVTQWGLYQESLIGDGGVDNSRLDNGDDDVPSFSATSADGDDDHNTHPLEEGIGNAG